MLAPAADPEPAAKRMRIDIETARTTIRPRARPPAPPAPADGIAGAVTAIAPFGAREIAAGTADGQLYRVTPRGQAVRLAPALPGEVVALDGRAGLLAAAAEATALVLAGEAEPLRLAHEHALGAAALSPCGGWLACGHMAGITLHRLDGSAERREIGFPGGPTALAWSPDGTWLAAPLGAGGVQLTRPEDGRTAHIARFPAPVRDTVWSGAAGALVTSGAFRVSAWTMDPPPLDGDMSGALATGRPGLVPVAAVTAHPGRDLVAAGYDSGLTVIAQLGQRDELMLRPDTGGAVTVLAWSPDGDRLALGDSAGQAAIAEFPPQMFK
ncbi:hypothetical protein LNKW23_23360 [Paralimibaculum aggregatum]|uniref:Anaphase-promoting complex subunit 4 WD40 domain-containing protein n=1 Tax=Paralimibaculum aggregatum TaxID=3036245 RepID=A0ABQ6LQ41_9RHOB|nr:hypothetical protein LNKW23_23360 [Limibaculum sp. NKW23]